MSELDKYTVLQAWPLPMDYDMYVALDFDAKITEIRSPLFNNIGAIIICRYERWQAGGIAPNTGEAY